MAAERSTPNSGVINPAMVMTTPIARNVRGMRESRAAKRSSSPNATLTAATI
jgi:hypothetical protein